MIMRKRSFTGTTSNAITQREIDNRALARKAAAEGFVLLKNDGMTLPLKKGSKIAVYGAGALYTVKGGTGSGDVNERESVTIYQGLCNAGFEITNRTWLDNYAAKYEATRLKWREKILSAAGNSLGSFFYTYASMPFVAPVGDTIDVDECKADGADVAFFVVRRIAGEAADRHAIAGDYYLTSEEQSLLEQVCKAYDRVVLVINTGSVIDLSFADALPNIMAIVYYVQAGQEGGNAFADIVCGDVTPSGKLTDSWAVNYTDYPNATYFSSASGDVFKEEYREGIYVGYRYFDTFDVPMRYSFGYGLSYTDFAIMPGKITVTGMGTKHPMVHVEVDVRNVGDTYSGKEVIQIYTSCPQGKLQKEFRRLCGFAKTRILEPGETQHVKISFALYQLASYCEKSAAWILEGGSYGIWVGNSLQNAVLSESMTLDTDAVMVKCRNICPQKEPLMEIAPDGEKLRIRQAEWLSCVEGLPKVNVSAAGIITEIVNYDRPTDVLPGKAGTIADSLSANQLIALVTGDISKGQGSALGAAGQTVPGAAAETVSVKTRDSLDIASIVLADGPAGLRLSKSYQVVDGQIIRGDFLDAIEGGFFSKPKEQVGTTYYQYCTAIPVGTLIAQTWNLDLVKQLGEMIGHEMELFEVTLWLAPGMNIHRNPLCGRNFEYYSEDPLLSGMMASAMTLGVQKVPGCGTTIKHFACNNQEDNRMGSDSVVSERALREIYLKNFEITVKNSQPMSIMTSYNLINGTHTANSYDLCTRVTRDEWCFTGAIMTDWTTTTNSTAGRCTAADCIKAGNDMIMPGDPSDHASIRAALADGTLDIWELRRCVCNTLNVILRSNQYEKPMSYCKHFLKLDTYMQVR